MSTLGQDPRTVNHPNGESYQQAVLIKFNSEPCRSCSGQDTRWPVMRCLCYQYAAFYITASVNASVRHRSQSRRALSDDKTGSQTF